MAPDKFSYTTIKKFSNFNNLIFLVNFALLTTNLYRLLLLQYTSTYTNL